MLLEQLQRAKKILLDAVHEVATSTGEAPRLFPRIAMSKRNRTGLIAI
jgi:hypothetical protein